MATKKLLTPPQSTTHGILESVEETTENQDCVTLQGNGDSVPTVTCEENLDSLHSSTPNSDLQPVPEIEVFPETAVPESNTPLSPEDEIEVELRHPTSNISLSSEHSRDFRSREFNLLEFSPDIVRQLRLTPASAQSDGKDSSCHVPLEHSPLGNPRSEVSGDRSWLEGRWNFKGMGSPLEESQPVPGCSPELDQRERSSSGPSDMLSHPIYREPLSLIQSDPAGHLYLNQRTLQLLDTLDTPLVVVGIAGSYRSGKSYLLNYLADRKEGFQVGNTVETCTRGIWIWCLPHPLLPDTTLIWMDTEGLDDPDKGDYNFDMQVIVLTLLLSSTFIYNTQGRIDNTLIKQLGFVSDLTNHLQVRTGQEKETGDDFDLYFPNLFVVVRDFFLELKTKTTMITSDEYFEQCLRVKEISVKPETRHVREYNEPRIKIRKFFPASKRYCRTLPNPNRCNYRNGLLNYFLGTAKEELNPDFWVQAEELRELLLNVSPQKSFGQCDKVNGRMFGTMAQCYIGAIEQGEIPCIQSAFQLTAMQENRRILELALTEYRSGLLDLCMPLSQEQLYHVHQNLMRDLLEKYRKKIIFEEAHDFRQEYDSSVTNLYNEMVTLNETKSQELCELLLDQLNETIANKFRKGEYLCSGGYAIYRDDLQVLKTKYETMPNKGVKSDYVLHKFLQHKESEIGTIVAIDKEMSIIRVQEEAEKRQKVEIELREKMLTDEATRAREREEQLRHSLLQNQETLQKEMERRLADQQTKFEQLMKQREENHETLVSELRTEIGRLKSHSIGRVVKTIGGRRCTIM